MKYIALEKTWKEASFIYFPTLSQKLFRRTVEKHKNNNWTIKTTYENKINWRISSFR